MRGVFAIVRRTARIPRYFDTLGTSGEQSYYVGTAGLSS